MKPYEPFKYATEAGVNMYLGPYQLCQQTDFQYLEQDDLIPYYNIYFICQRNRIEAKPETATISENFISLYFDIYDKKEIFAVPAGFDNLFKSKNVKLEADYPHNYIIVTNIENDKMLIKASHVLDEARGSILPDPTFLDLEVLYVGQTKRDSEMPIIDRLINHETLQKIYSEKMPDKEIYLLLCCFEADSFIESRGTVRTQKEFEEEDIKRFETFIQNKAELSLEQRVNVTEAALIRYFDPKYNKIYKNTFPKETHTKYDECYKLDLNSISIEINCVNTLFSAKVPPAKYHSKSFRLVTDGERRDLFDYSVGFDTLTDDKE